ncbi:MAG: hypothetical protein K2K56_03810 [Lachnospiraceae bacterium]|nr:hypothetical protein [Lachnospiraceae bacterium]
MSKIEIDLQSLKTAALTLKTAVDDFTPHYKEFVGSAMDCLQSYNSDYLEEFEKLLRIYKDDRTKKTLESVSNYCSELNSVFNIWEEADEAIAMKIKGGNKNC